MTVWPEPDGVSRREFLKAGAAAGAFALLAGVAPGVVWAGTRPRPELERLGELVRPWDVAAGPGGELYVANAGRYGVVRLAGGERSWLGEGPGTGPGRFNFPLGVDAGPDGIVYIADTNNGRVQLFGADGGFVRAFGRPGYLDGEFLRPKSVGAYLNGCLVADTRNHRIQYVDLAGARVGTRDPVTRAILGGLGDGPGDLKLPRYVTSDADGRVYVSDAGHAVVKVYTLDGRLVRALGGGKLAEPSGLAVAADGVTYVADAGAARVHVFGRDGRGRGVVPGFKGLSQPRGLAFADGYLLCADPAAGRVFMAEV